MDKRSSDTRQISPIAYIENCFSAKFGIPRQSGRAPGILSRIVFLPEYRNPDALRGMEGYSHLWLIFGFSESVREEFSPTVRPPRLGGNRRVGVFASRSPFRPNSIGLSSVRLERIEYGDEGPVPVVSGADLMNGTPIYDIKPYIPSSDSHPDAAGGYSADFTDYRLSVSDPGGFLENLPGEIKSAAYECISDDPRPSYQDDPERVYTMTLGNYDISFRVSGTDAVITRTETLNERKKNN